MPPPAAHPHLATDWARPLRTLCLGLCAWSLAGAACAVASNYQCADGRRLVGQFTPRKVQLHLIQANGTPQQTWMLDRTREEGQARYRQPKGPVQLVVARHQAELTLDEQTPPLVCKLQRGEFPLSAVQGR